jgi:putative transposase
MRAGMAAHPRDYPWSSYLANADGNNNKPIAQHTLYSHLGTDASERQCAYRQLFQAAIGQSDLDAIREVTNKGWETVENRVRLDLMCVS